MIGIVVVSHSRRLALAAVDLALEMVPTAGLRVAVAAGGPGGVTGTDPLAVRAAIAEVATDEGVLVLMDVGSSVLSAETAMELDGLPPVPVRLTAAPLVEGLLAAVVTAAGGADLAAVDREARGALAAKRGHLAADEPGTPAGGPAPAGTAGPEVPPITRDLRLPNPAGMHARAAAQLVSALTGLDATVTVANRRTGRAPVPVSGSTALLALDGRQGDVLTFGAFGPHAGEALRRIGRLVAAGFGETPAGAAAPAPAPSSAPRGPVGVSPGRGTGPVVRMPDAVAEPAATPLVADDARRAEAARIGAAAAAVADALRERAAGAADEAAAILEATALLAEDPAVLGDARARVLRDGLPAPAAAWRAFTAAASAVAAGGGVAAGRASDVADVRHRVVAALAGLPVPGIPQRSEPFVLVAADLAPADTALLDPATCRALVTAAGGPTSHSAILARALGIPAVAGAPEALAIPPGTVLWVDGSTGELVVDPGPGYDEPAGAGAAAPVFDGHGRLRDGTPVPLRANVAGAVDAERAAAAAAQGVGLFRTELVFLGRAAPPSLERQVEAYRAVLERFDDVVVVRTLDAGADRPLAFLAAPPGPNPALGLRGVRAAWRDPGLLAGQLDAIARAGQLAGTAPWVMAPMVTTVEDARTFVALARERGIEHAGVMVETPAAALLAEELLAVADFASIGTNDLVQYTMAADRLVGELAPLNDPWQPAVLRLVARVGQAGRTAAKPVAVCGEAAGDPLLAAVLVGCGVTSLSMAPTLLGAVAAQLAEVDRAACERAARAARAATDPAGARAAARRALGSAAGW